jgi:predicted MFS family arabinose efflux permease
MENIPVGLLPQLAHSLHRSRSATGYLVTAYALVVVIGSVPLALVLRRLTRRRLLIGALTVFVAGCAAGAAAQTYGQLLATRLAIAAGHCVFWAVVAAAGAALVPRERRGHALAMVFSGSSLAGVLGIPAVTWLGQQTSWRVATLAASGLGLISLTAIVVLLPATAVEEEQQAAPHPSRRRFALVLAALALTMAGAFAMLTYVTVFLLNLGGFRTAAISPILLVSGGSGAIGVWVSARYAGHHARPTMLAGVAGLTASLGALALFAHHGTLDIVLLCPYGFSLSVVAVAVQSRCLDHAPGSINVASAANSAVFNVGIGGGALLGGLLLQHVGARAIPVAGCISTGLALLLLLAEPAQTTVGSQSRTATRNAGSSV